MAMSVPLDIPIQILCIIICTCTSAVSRVAATCAAVSDAGEMQFTHGHVCLSGYTNTNTVHESTLPSVRSGGCPCTRAIRPDGQP